MPPVGTLRRLCQALRMEYVTPTVGLMTLAGCLTFLVAPDEKPGAEERLAAAWNAAHPTIVIDAGHGGRDAGAQANQLVEKDLTLDLAFRVEERLKARGYPTLMTRTGDDYLPLSERVELANQVPFGLFVSLHFNKSANREAHGVEVFYASEKIRPEPAWAWAGFFARPAPDEAGDRGENFAGTLQAALVSALDAENRGIRGRPLYVVRHTRMPAVLVEGGFLSNTFEAGLLATPAYRDRLADAVVAGVVEYANTLPRPPVPRTQLAKASP
jgi:N-acetylmuramoyl-L-alanine amidase